MKKTERLPWEEKDSDVGIQRRNFTEMSAMSNLATGVEAFFPHKALGTKQFWRKI